MTTPIEQFIADAEKHQQFDDIPTLCAMLKAAIEGLSKIATNPTSGNLWGDARSTLTHLNTLATEALGTEQKYGQ